MGASGLRSSCASTARNSSLRRLAAWISRCRRCSRRSFTISVTPGSSSCRVPVTRTGSRDPPACRIWTSPSALPKAERSRSCRKVPASSGSRKDGDRPAEQLCTGNARHFHEPRVGVEHLAIGRGGDHALLHALEDRQVRTVRVAEAGTSSSPFTTTPSISPLRMASRALSASARRSRASTSAISSDACPCPRDTSVRRAGTASSPRRNAASRVDSMAPAARNRANASWWRSATQSRSATE